MATRVNCSIDIILRIWLMQIKKYYEKHPHPTSRYNLHKTMFVSPFVSDHLYWETTQICGCSIQGFTINRIYNIHKRVKFSSHVFQLAISWNSTSPGHMQPRFWHGVSWNPGRAMSARESWRTCWTPSSGNWITSSNVIQDLMKYMGR